MEWVMCDACVIEAVKRRPIGRRQALKAAAAFSAVAVGSVLFESLVADAAAPVLADLTHELHAGFPTFSGESQFVMTNKANFAKHKFNMNQLTYIEHTGTHIDAPLNFVDGGMTVSEIPIGQLIVPLVVIDIRAKADADPNASLTPDDVSAWIKANGPLPKNCCVAMNSGWDRFVDTPQFRNADAKGMMHFPGIHPDTAHMLLETGDVVGIAVDTLSLDRGQGRDFATHRAWLPAGRWGIEALANLSSLPARGATLVAGAPKIRGGTGGPGRFFAVIPASK